MAQDNMRRPLLASWISMTAIAVTVNVPPVCLTSIEAQFGLNHTEGGFLLTTVLMGFLAALAVAGPLADRIGLRALLAAAPAMQIAGLLAGAFAPTYSAMVAGALMMGAGSGVLEALVNPIVCLCSPEDKTRAVNFLHSFYAAGAAISVLGASLLINAGGSWRSAYVAGCALPAAYGALYAFSELPRLPAQEKGAAGAMELLRNPLFILLLASIFLAGGTELGPAQWIPAYMEETFGMTKLGSSIGLALFSAAMMCGRLTMSRLSGAARPAALLKIACAVCAAMIALAASLRGGAWAAAAFFIFGFFVSMFWPTILAIGAYAFPQAGATMFSMLGLAGNAGGIFPLAAGAAADRWGLRAGIGMLALLPLALLWTLAMAQRRLESDKPTH